jgi:hypothetical protein
VRQHYFSWVSFGSDCQHSGQTDKGIHLPDCIGLRKMSLLRCREKFVRNTRVLAIFLSVFLHSLILKGKLFCKQLGILLMVVFLLDKLTSFFSKLSIPF